GLRRQGELSPTKEYPMAKLRSRALALLLFALILGVSARHAAVALPEDEKNPHPKQGSGIVIELDNAFIKTYMDRATIETEFLPTAYSKVHPAKSDGEIHVAGYASAVNLPTVVEVMNAGKAGTKAAKA